jgi:hypothetical protein
MNLPYCRKPLFALMLCCVCLALSFSAKAQDKDWRPVSPEDLASKAPVVEPDADAEAIFWEVRIDDSKESKLMENHYVRVKIFTERGREKYSKFDVPFTRGIKIKDLQARVIRPDGTIVEISDNDIFEREIVKAGGIKIKAKSFAIPNIEPGVIVEYRYRQIDEDAGARGMRLSFQRDVPVRTLSYYYKPFNQKEPSYHNYNFDDVKFVKDKNGFYLAQKQNVPSFKEEPRMPPEDTVKPWMMLTGSTVRITSISEMSIGFTIKDPRSPQLYWSAVAADYRGLVQFMNKKNGDVAKAAADITAGATNDEEKLRKLYEFCQTQIRNTDFDTTLTDEDRQKLPATKSFNDVLKRKSASSQFVDMLFGALSNSLGFDTRVAFSANRNKMFFSPEMTNESFIHPAAIAVKQGENWKFFNPGMPFVPYGMLVWYEEGVYALIVGDGVFEWRKTPMTDTKDSELRRYGKFTLAEDGTLEGSVTVEARGQSALSYRVDNYDDSADKRIESLKNELKARLSTAEISDVTIDNVTDPSKPLITRYKIKVPSYAQKTGKRLFLQPGFFGYNTNPLFGTGTRKYDIYFRYPWSENDQIVIQLPAGYALDNADAPGQVADPSKIASDTVLMSLDNGSNSLKYNRKFYFGSNGLILFPNTAYPALKGIFDAFQKADTHTITLKQN